MNILFMGTPDFAVPSLEAIASESGFHILAVVTQPDRRKGRGRVLTPPPVKESAERLSLPVIQPSRASDPAFIEAIRNLAPDLVVVVAYGQILKKEFLNIPPKGTINLHGSILPKYRGAAPIQRAVINGDKVTGVTTMLLNEGMDEGDIFLKREINIEENDTAGTLFDRLKVIGAELLIDTLRGIAEERIAARPQEESMATYAAKITKEECRINWSAPADHVNNRIRGLTPFPGAYTLLNGKRLIVSSVEKEERFEGSPGELRLAGEDKLIVATATEGLSIKRVKPEGKREMDIADFLSGNKIEDGLVLGS